MTSRRDNGEGTAPRQRADGRWEIKLWVRDERTDKLHRRSVYARTKTEVRAKAQEIQARIRDGHSAVDSHMSVSAWIDHWLGSTLPASGMRESTRAGYRYVLLSTIIQDSPLASTPLSRVRPSTIDAWTTGLREGGAHKESTLLSYFNKLKRCLDGAVRDGLIRTNPCLDAERPCANEPDVGIFTSAQLARFEQATKQSPHQAIWALLRVTGMREGEALALEWADFSDDLGTIRITKSVARVGSGRTAIGPPKTKAAIRSVSLPAHLVATLRAHRLEQKKLKLRNAAVWKKGDWVFTTAVGTRVDARNLLRDFRRVVAAADAGIPANVTPHSLRHNVVTALIEAGVPLHSVSAYMGHANVQTTLRVYAHVTQKSQDAILTALESFGEDPAVATISMDN